MLDHTERRLTDLLHDTEAQVDAARRLLLGASAAALLAAIGLRGLVLRWVRQASDQLASSEEQFRSMVDAAPSLLREHFPNLPVLFCSGYSEQLMSETGHLPTGATLLQKPYDAHDLIARVREMLDHRIRDGQAGTG